MNTDDLYDMLGLGDALPDIPEDRIDHKDYEAPEATTRNDTAIAVDQWGLRRGRELAACPRWEATGLDEHAASDCFAAAFEPNPELQPCNDRFREQFFTALLETPDYSAMHGSTMLDDIASEIAALHYGDELAKARPKPDEKRDMSDFGKPDPELGAEIHAEEPVTEWKVVGDGVEVTTEKETYRGNRLIVTAGAWAGKLLAGLGVPLTVMRQVMLWIDVSANPYTFRRDRFPIFIADVPGGPFYGLPAIDEYGLKIARHYGAPELSSPDEVNWDATTEDVPAVKAFLDRHVLGASGPVTNGQVCMYTLTPDKHFVIDVHPRHPQVSVACGFSGHGFKFASVVGEILADLAERGQTNHAIEMFSAKRFGV